jgi:hypothetical protein
VALVGMDDEIIAVVKDVPGWHGSATPRPTRSCQAYRMP